MKEKYFLFKNNQLYCVYIQVILSVNKKKEFVNQKTTQQQLEHKAGMCK